MSCLDVIFAFCVTFKGSFMKSDVVWNAVYLEPSGDSFNYKAVASAVENIEAHLPLSGS